MNIILVGGWAYPSEKYDFVSWDDEIPNWMGKKMFQTANQNTNETISYFH